MTVTVPPGLESALLEVDDHGVAWVTLNRPAAANSRNQRMRTELAAIYTALAPALDVKVVVLTGAGDRFFCAGMDLKEAGQPETPLERRARLRGARDIEQLARLPQPTIAAINGLALGGGCEMALACDIRLIATEAAIGLPEVTHGLAPGGGGTQRLPRVVGFARAAELIFRGKALDGAAAVEFGLANGHVPAAELRERTSVLAREIAAHPAEGLRAAKEALLASLEVPLSVGVERELDALLFLLAERDRRAATGNGDVAASAATPT